MIALLTLGFTLSLDNFRTSIVLGGLKPTLLRSVKTSFIFGLWDGIAPLVGILIGGYLSNKVDSTADMVAAIGLAGYGLFIVARALLSDEHADPDLRFATRGLPLPLSVDNVAAGASLGLVGFSPWLAPAPVRDDHVCDVGRRAPDRPHGGPLHTPHPHRPVDRDCVRRDGSLSGSWHQPPGRRLTPDARPGALAAYGLYPLSNIRSTSKVQPNMVATQWTTLRSTSTWSSIRSYSC